MKQVLRKKIREYKSPKRPDLHSDLQGRKRVVSRGGPDKGVPEMGGKDELVLLDEV